MTTTAGSTGAITGTARVHGDAVVVEVYPGGALAAIRLSHRAPALGARGLAAAIVAAVAEATAMANQRTRHAHGEAIAALHLDDAAGLDPALTERTEATTPPTWR